MTRDPYVIRVAKRANHAFQQGDTEESLAIINRALQVVRRDASLIFARGRIHLARGELIEAMNDFEFVSTNVNNGQATAGWAYCVGLMNGGEPERVLTLYHRAKREGFVSAGMLNNMGHCYMLTRNFTAAKRSFEDAIELDSSLHSAYLHLGEIEFQEAVREKRIPNAKWIEKAVSLEPLYSKPFKLLAITCAVGFRNTPVEQEAARIQWKERTLRAFSNAVAHGAQSAELSEKLKQVAGFQVVTEGLPSDLFRKSTSAETEIQVVIDPFLGMSDALSLTPVRLLK